MGNESGNAADVGTDAWLESPKKRWAGQGASSSSAIRDESGGQLGEFYGLIKSFNENNGWGFIQSDDLDALGHGDAFLHFTEKKQFKVGHKVKFQCFLTSKMRPQAKDLK